MSFQGITFDGQNVSPKDDGALYNVHYGDGIIQGCAMSISGDDFIMQDGYIVACGRVCHVNGATEVSLATRTYTDGYIQVILNYDVSQGEGNQWYPSFVEQATTTFPALTTDDINTTGTLYQVQLAIIEVAGGNLTSIVSNTALRRTTVINRYNGTTPLSSFESYGNITSIYAMDTDGVTPTSGIRMHNDGSNMIAFSNNGAFAYRPKGKGSTDGQFLISTTGVATVSGSGINIDPPSGTNANIYLKSGGTSKAQIYYDQSNGILRLNSVDGGTVNIYDSGYIYLSANNKAIYIRPTGSATDQIYFNTSGQQVGGHNFKNGDNTSGTGKSVSNSTNWTNLTSVTGLDSSGYYLFWGKASFAPSAATAGILSLAMSTTSNGNQQSWANSCWTASSGVKYIEVFAMGGISTTTMYLNAQSNGVASSVSTYYFRAIRIA